MLHAGAGELLFQLLWLKGDQGIEEAFAADGFVAREQGEQDDQPDDEADQIADISRGQQDEARVFEREAELIVGLAVVGDGDKGDIQGGGGGEPAGIDGKLAERDRADNADGGGQGAWRVQGGEPQTVDAQLHDDQLPVDGQAGRLDCEDELKDLRYVLRVLQT